MLGEESFNIISIDASQVGSDDATKQYFWENMNELIQEISSGEKIFIEGDLKEHVKRYNVGFEKVHGGYNFGDKNKEMLF